MAAVGIKSFQVDDVDFTEEGLRGLLKVKDKLPPSLKVLTMDGSFKVAYVVGDNKITHCRAKDLYDAMLLLLVTYYVMDLDYPAVYGQLLGFLQQFIIEEPYTFFKGTNYFQMAHKVSSSKS